MRWVFLSLLFSLFSSVSVLSKPQQPCFPKVIPKQSLLELRPSPSADQLSLVKNPFPVTHPCWQDEVIGAVDFDKARAKGLGREDQKKKTKRRAKKWKEKSRARRAKRQKKKAKKSVAQSRYWGKVRRDYRRYTINPDGVIYGYELLRLVPVQEFSEFQFEFNQSRTPVRSKVRSCRNLRPRSLDGSQLSPVNLTYAELSQILDQDVSARRAYSQVLQNLSHRGLAALTLNRILDHEAMKLNVNPHVSDIRVSHFIRTILNSNAIDSGNVLVDRDVTYFRFGKSIAHDLQGKPIEKSSRVRRIRTQKVIPPEERLFECPGDDQVRSFEKVDLPTRYCWLRRSLMHPETLRPRGVDFEADWDSDLGDLNLSKFLIATQANDRIVPWPNYTSAGPVARVSFPCVPTLNGDFNLIYTGCLPETFSEFETAVRQRLDHYYRAQLRRLVLSGLTISLGRHPLGLRAATTSNAQLDAYYAALTARDEAGEYLVQGHPLAVVVRAPEVEGYFLDLKARGPMAFEFLSELRRSVLEAEKRLFAKLNQVASDKGFERRDFEVFLGTHRQQELEALIFKTLEKFKSDVDLGLLTVQTHYQKLVHQSGDRQPLTPEEIEEKNDLFYRTGQGAAVSTAEAAEHFRRARVLDPHWESDGRRILFFPAHEYFDSLGGDQDEQLVPSVMFLLSRSEEKAPNLPLSDPRVQSSLRRHLMSLNQAFFLRETVYELFLRNPFRFTPGYCQRTAAEGSAFWPCSVEMRDTDLKRRARYWADMLFPETVFPQSLIDQYGLHSLERDASRLSGQREPFDSLRGVWEISLDALAAVFEIDNPHGDGLAHLYYAVEKSADLTP